MNTLRKFSPGRWLKEHVGCTPFRVSGFTNTLKRGHRTGAQSQTAFTLVELLVVIGTIALLAVVLLPAFAGAKPDGQAIQCRNNLRQLTVGWTMYAGDNTDKFLDPAKWVSGKMDWGNSVDNTDVSSMLNTDALIFPYVKSATFFKCPADVYQSPQNMGPRIRSYSLDGVLGGAPSLGSNYAPGNPPEMRTYITTYKVSELSKPGPGNIYVFLDEHPDSINDGAFMLNAGRYPIGNEKWRDFPGSLHNRCVSISFADGRAEMHRWLKYTTCQGVEYKSFSTTSLPCTTPLNQMANIGSSPDYEWLEDRMPYR
jgi:type II secretory pathway pseudopilin PulG